MLLKDKLTFYQKYKQLSNWNDIFKENILKKKFVIERYTIKHNKYKEKANKITFLDWIQRQKNDTKKLSPASLWEPHKKDILAFRQWKLNSQTRKKLVATASPWWGRLQQVSRAWLFAKEEEQGSGKMAYFLSQTKNKPEQSKLCSDVVKTSGLEPPTPCMSSRYSNQLSYTFIII